MAAAGFMFVTNMGTSENQAIIATVYDDVKQNFQSSLSEIPVQWVNAALRDAALRMINNAKRTNEAPIEVRKGAAKARA